jgi:hypothetical protein
MVINGVLQILLPVVSPFTFRPINREIIMINKNHNVIQEDRIVAKIYLLRGQKVLPDKDLAVLYGVKPIRLREQVKRNIDCFPERFMFQLSTEEVDLMVSQNAIPSKQKLGGHHPYAFSEYGVLMLANILKSSSAIQMSIRIIEVFLKMREMIMTHKDILLQLEKWKVVLIRTVTIYS